ncbi:MAG: serine/threonine-protein kinase, partial [Xanthomonadales bacterium]|nr:serine/threonine-protein kinase [Xanthomonadales bacterium]
IFDAGTTPGGYPYFVMEFVPGKDIKTHCDDAKLSIRGRIRLFLQVCDGVLHAHQKGLIHRDLKPSNILVKPKSEQPALVKLIDFGIAKSISGGLGTGLHTRLGSFVGTPVYSSPEQVTDPTREIDTRADLYSLGVVLYEILTGVPPRSAQELDADTPAQLAKRLRDTKTPAMGTRYSGLSPAEQQRIAELRALSTDGLSMQLCSDLDWIVGKCIAQDPDDRYATVQDLRQDLQRWLDGRPVEARPSTVWYRFGKLVRRNKLNTAILATLSVALLGATTAAVTGFIRAEQALHEAEAAIDFQNRQITGMSPSAMAAGLRDTLEKEGARSLENIDMTHISTNLIVDFFSKPALRILDAEYSGQALLQAKLRAKQAEILHRLSRQDLALSTIDSAIDSLDRILDADDQELINTHLLRARILIDLDRFADAREIINQIVQKSRDQGTAGKLTLGQALALNCEYGARGYDLDPKLRVTCDEAVGALRDSLGENDPTVLEVRANRAGLLLQSGLAEEATAEASAVLGLLGKEWSDIKLNVSSSLALGLTKMGREDQALVILQEMKDALVEKYGYRHAGTVAALHNLAATHNQLRQFEAGAKLAEQAMTLQLELYGSANLNSLWAMLTYSRSLEGIGDLAKESEILSRIMQLADKDRIEVKEHLLLPVSMAMARIMIRKGKLEDAEQVLRDASLLVEQVPNIKPSIRLQLKISQAELLLLRDQISEAATLLDEVRGELRNAVDRDKAEIQRLGNLADSFFATVQARQGKQAEAEALYRATLERQLTRIPGPYADYLYTMRELSSLLSLAQRHAEAVSLCRDGLERAKVALHPNHPEMALQLEQCEAARLAAGR